MKKSILIGKIGNSKVQLDVELQRITKPAITTFLTPIDSNGYLRLSISGSIGKHSYGQIHDSIYPAEFDELYVDSEWLIKLLAIWKACHLNDMNAGTELQMEYIDFYRNQFLKNDGYVDYDKICAMLEQHHLLIDNETNPQLNVGYKYGTAWLIRMLPDSIEQFFQSIPTTSPTSV